MSSPSTIEVTLQRFVVVMFLLCVLACIFDFVLLGRSRQLQQQLVAAEQACTCCDPLLGADHDQR